MCSTIQSFNDTFRSFLQELVDVFPETEGASTVRIFLAGFDGIIAADDRAALTPFLEAISPHADLVTTKDPALFKKLELPGGVSLRGLWKQASDGTKDAVWQYLQMLFLLGTTAASVPPEMLDAIETMATQYAEKVQTGEMDIASVTSMLLGNGGALGQLDFGGLMSSLPPPPPPPPKKKPTDGRGNGK
jgi:hypothetical protein